MDCSEMYVNLMKDYVFNLVFHHYRVEHNFVLKSNCVYRINDMKMEKTFFGSKIDIRVDGGVKLTLYTYMNEKLLEKDPYIYNFLENSVKFSKLYVKNIDNIGIQFTDSERFR